MKIAISPTIIKRHPKILDLMTSEHPTVLNQLEDLTFTYPDMAVVAETDLPQVPAEVIGATLLIVISKPQTRLHKFFQHINTTHAFAVLTHHELATLPAIITKATTDINERRATQPQPYTLRITATTGGVGKTFLSYQLALSLTKATRFRPLIIDLSRPFPTLPAMLNITPSKSWQSVKSVLETGGEITAQSLAQIITTTPYGFDVLSAPSDDTPALSEAALTKLITASHQLTPLVIVDEPVRLSPLSATNLNQSHKQLFVTWPHPSSLMSSLQVYQQLAEHQPQSLPDTMFVLNGYEPKFHHKLLKNSPDQVLKFNQKIEFDADAIRESQRERKPIDEPTSIVYDDVRRLTHTILKWWEIK